jgi:site-specific DNA recombinase
MAAKHSTRAALVSAVGYVRRSSDKQEKSLPEQRASLERYAREHGYRIVRWYEDDAISGDATHKRHGFLAMHKAACASNRDFAVILVWDQDRFGRFDSLEAGFWVHPLVKAGVQLVTVGDGLIDWTDFTGRMMYGIKQEGKHQFLRDLSRNATRGLIARAQRGEWPAGRPPLGFSVDENGRLIHGDASDVAIIRRIFRSYLDGCSIQKIVQALNAEGLKTSKGGSFYRSTVRYVLTNRLYAGDFVWNERCQAKYNGIRGGSVQANPKQGYNQEADWILIENNHKPIISRETFEAVRARLCECKNKSGQPGTNSLRPDKFALTGLLTCKKCGARMYGCSVSGFNYFVCGGYMHKGSTFCNRNAVRQELLLEAVIGTIERNCDGKKLRAELRREVADSAAGVSVPKLAAAIAANEAKLTKAKKRLVEVESDMLPIVQDHIRSLQAEQDQLRTAMKSARTPQKDLLADVDDRVSAAMKLFARLRESLTLADMETLGDLLRAAVSQVVVDVERLPCNGKRHRFGLRGGSIRLNPSKTTGSPRSTLVWSTYDEQPIASS